MPAALTVVWIKVSGKDRMEILATMQSDRVLGVRAVPQKSSSNQFKIQPLDGNRLQISGDLTIETKRIA